MVSKNAEKATMALLTAGDFGLERSIAGGVAGLRLATAAAITTCMALKIEKGEMIRGDARGAFFLRSVYKVFTGA